MSSPLRCVFHSLDDHQQPVRLLVPTQLVRQRGHPRRVYIHEQQGSSPARAHCHLHARRSLGLVFLPTSLADCCARSPPASARSSRARLLALVVACARPRRLCHLFGHRSQRSVQSSLA